MNIDKGCAGFIALMIFLMARGGLVVASTPSIYEWHNDLKWDKFTETDWLGDSWTTNNSDGTQAFHFHIWRVDNVSWQYGTVVWITLILLYFPIWFMVGLLIVFWWNDRYEERERENDDRQ